MILQADGSPQITPVATPEPTPSETPTPTPTQTPEPTVTPTPAGENTPTPTPGQEGAEPQEVTEQPTPEPTPAPETTPEAAQETAVEENIPVITAFPQSVEVPVTVEDYRFWTSICQQKKRHRRKWFWRSKKRSHRLPGVWEGWKKVVSVIF